jgi:hypothetical protein
MVDEKLRTRDAAKAIVAVDQVRGAAVVIEHTRRARQRFDASAAFLTVETVADSGENGLAAPFAANAPADA